MSLQYFKTYLQNHNLLHASVKAETSGNCESSDKCFDCFAGSDIRYLTRGTYPSSDSLAGHIRCGTIGTKASRPDMSKHLSRHENKTYPLMLTERSGATEATEARHSKTGTQNITNWQIISTKFKEWNYGHLISQFLAQGRMISCEGHTFVDDSLSDSPDVERFSHVPHCQASLCIPTALQPCPPCILPYSAVAPNSNKCKVPMSLQYFKTYLQNHNLLHASVKAETSGNSETSDKCFDCFAGSDIRYLTRGTYPSSDSLAGHIRCGTIGTKASRPDMSKHLSRHENKAYPLMLTERSEATEATEATEARQGHKTSQIGKQKSTEFKEWNYGHLISQFLAQGRMISCEGHTFVDDSLSDFTRCGTIFTCSSLPSIPMYPYSPTALSSMYTSLQCCSSKL